jgi:hypothetical protein
MGGFLAQAPWMCAQTAPPRQPVYVFVTSSVGDYVNADMSEERLRRSLASLEKYRKADPGLTATLYLSGAMSDALAQHNDRDHLLDFVRGYIAQGAVRPAYDGTEEPTYERRPMLNFSGAKDAEDRWLIRMDSAKELLTQARDPLTGAPLPGKSGGLKRMQEVFGEATVIRGVLLQFPNVWGAVSEVGDDGEIVNVIRQLNKNAIMVGLSETDLAHTSGSMFRPWASDFSKVMSPEANTSPELFWQENVLRVSETSTSDWRTFRAEDGVEKLKAALAALDRSHVRVLHVELGGERMYVKPSPPSQGRVIMPLTWAWAHPDAPLFPSDLRFSAEQTEAKYAQQDEVLKFLASEFLPANPGSRFVSATDLKSLAKPGVGYDVSVEKLRGSVGDMLAAWGDKATPPAFLKVDDRYLSLADLFEVLADSLAQRSRSGKFPVSVRVGRVFGPVLAAAPKPSAEGEVSADSVARTAAKLIDAMHDDEWNPRPRNAVPSPIQIDGFTLSPAQFLRLMAEALVAPSPDTMLRIKPTEMFAGRVMRYYTRRLFSDLGAPWTYKPAVIDASAGAR